MHRHAIRRPGSLIALGLALAAAAGCGGTGGGGRGGATSGAAGAAGSAGSAVSAAHWQVALAALGSSYAPRPLALDQAGLDRWNDLIARSWAALRPAIDAEIEAKIRSIAGLGGTISIQSIRNIAIDTAAAPALAVSGAPPLETVMLRLPSAPATWSIGFTADVGATLTTSLFGFPLRATVTMDVVAEASDVRIEQPIAMDLSDPRRPRLAGAGAPALSVRVQLSSSNPLLAQVTGPLTQLLDPVVRAALFAGSLVVERQLGVLIAQVPQAPWGQGAPPARPVSGAAPLEPLADAISDEIQRDHMPCGTVLPAEFDAPGYGNGKVVHYFDHGDSAIWTGHYLAAEAFRYDLTGDLRALAGARRALAGLAACLEVAIPGDGLLSRCAIPLASPWIADIQGSGSFFTGTVGGQPYGALDDISRDQYLGALFGLEQAYLRIPALRPDAAALISRIVGYLDRHGWVAYRADGVTPSTAFGQSASALWAVLKAGNLVDRARWGALHDANAQVASILWFPSWASAIEVHESYYKFNLGHAEIMIATAAETDPALYREYVKSLEMDRAAIGDDQNAWFDAVYGIVVPPASPAMGPQVEAELQHWTLRERRGFSAQNSADPTIATAVYASPTNTGGPRVVAVLPIPIEKRPPTDFLWQRSPYELDGALDPRRQYPGVDLLLPYWAARAYGMIR